MATETGQVISKQLANKTFVKSVEELRKFWDEFLKTYGKGTVEGMKVSFSSDFMENVRVFNRVREYAVKHGSEDTLGFVECVDVLREKYSTELIEDSHLGEVAEFFEKMTSGIKNALSKNAKMTCGSCGFGMPKYSGRYPKHCPECGETFGSSGDTPEAPPTAEGLFAGFEKDLEVIQEEVQKRKNLISAIDELGKCPFNDMKAINSAMTRFLIQAESKPTLFKRFRPFYLRMLEKASKLSLSLADCETLREIFLGEKSRYVYHGTVKSGLLAFTTPAGYKEFEVTSRGKKVMKGLDNMNSSLLRITNAQGGKQAFIELQRYLDDGLVIAS